MSVAISGALWPPETSFRISISVAVSEPVEPIVYYLDRGAPEPIRSALLEGAGWWNQAFEAAGYRNAFRVELLPVDADPMDVRYNLIQWVHRFTRPMVTNARDIRYTPHVQVVMDMDGWGPPWLKFDSYHDYIKKEPVQFTGAER